MKFEISGKGIVCNVYYIEEEKLQEISALTCETGPGLKDLLEENSDYIVHVSRGFFADSSQSTFEFKLESGEKIDQSFYEEKIEIIADQDDSFEEFWDERDFRTTLNTPREKDITPSQVGIVEYHQFEEGIISAEIPCEDKNKLSDMKLVCASVEGFGPNGLDLATKATYGEGIVGVEEYENAEEAIMAVEVDGQRYSLPEATFEKSDSRVWLWVYDGENGEHSLDFFGSQSLPDPWVVDIVDLKLDDLYDNFNQDFSQLRKVHKFFNQKSLDWIKENDIYTRKYIQSHSGTKNLLGETTEELELPNFKSSNSKLDVCTLLCMLFEAYGIYGYDPEKFSELPEMDLELLDLETLALGNSSLLKSIKQSFCLHFNVINTITLGEHESFQEIPVPTLADAIRFVEEILNDPEASFNQD